jgi:hypothetical protein
MLKFAICIINIIIQTGAVADLCYMRLYHAHVLHSYFYDFDPLTIIMMVKHDNPNDFLAIKWVLSLPSSDYYTQQLVFLEPHEPVSADLPENNI